MLKAKFFFLLKCKLCPVLRAVSKGNVCRIYIFWFYVLFQFFIYVCKVILFHVVRPYVCPYVLVSLLGHSQTCCYFFMFFFFFLFVCLFVCF